MEVPWYKKYVLINMYINMYIIKFIYNNNIIMLQWLLLAGVAICIILGFISFVSIHNKNRYQLVLPFR